MIVFVTGMFRSGSTWSFNVARELLLHKYQRERIHISALNDTSETLLQADDHCDVILMKSHLLDRVGRSLIRGHAAKVIHTFRDPADAIRSGIHAFGWPFESCLHFISASFELMDLVVEAKNGCLIFYEDIQRVPIEIVTALANYLQISVHSEAIASIADRLTQERIKTFTDTLAAERQRMEAERHVVDLGFSYYDSETLLHRRHIGPCDYAAAVPLSDLQLSEIRHRFGSRIDAVGRLRFRRSRLYTSGIEQAVGYSA